MEKVKSGEIPGDDLEKLFDEFRHICDTLEDGKLTLEDSIKIYAKGIQLELKIQKIIDSASRRLVQIVKPDGTLEPFETKP